MVNKSVRYYYVSYARIRRQEERGLNKKFYKSFRRDLFAGIDKVINFMLNPVIEILDIKPLFSNGNSENSEERIPINLYQSFFSKKDIGRVYVVVSNDGIDGSNYWEKLVEKNNLADFLYKENFVSVSLFPPPALLSTF